MTSAAAASRRYRYADLVDLPDGKQYEILDGELVVNPSPVTRHQRIVGRLFFLLEEALGRSGMGEVFLAPLDVVFDEDNVVQPDVCYVSRENSGVVTENHLRGAPDFVVEVLSESTRRRDQLKKKNLYARRGVKLFLIVDPEADRVELYRLAGGEYAAPEIVTAPNALEILELACVRLDLAALFR